MRLLIVITAKLASKRLPGKVVREILPGLTLLELQVLRARRIGFPVVITCPETEGALIDYAHKLPVDDVFPGPPEDVVAQIFWAARDYNAELIVRGLPDCPYFDYEKTLRRAELLDIFSLADCTRSRHPFGRLPVYGVDEPVYTMNLLKKMVVSQEPWEREHFGSYVDRNRRKVNILYTPSPPVHLYRDEHRPFRLEVDTEDDLRMLSRLMAITGPRADPSAAIHVLEHRPDLVRINAHVEEATGPVISYKDFEKEHNEVYAKALYVGEGCYLSFGEGLEPVFCTQGNCLLGAEDEEGGVWLLDGTWIRRGEISCPCGAGRIWH